MPILNNLQQNPEYFHSLIIAPTRELAYQINEQFSILSAVFGLYGTLFVGGSDILQQNIALDNGVYVMIATPGRLVQVLQSRPKADVIKKLSHLQYLVLDEVDQFTTGSENFNKDIGTILEYLPAPDKRQTILTTASLTIELGELLKNSRFRLELAEQTMPKNLEFSYIVVPQYFYCEAYLSMLIEKITGF